MVKRIAYKEYANENGINRCLETVNGSYDAETKTIEVIISLYGDETDSVLFPALATEEKYIAACAGAVTAEEAVANRNEIIKAWMRSKAASASEIEAVLRLFA